MEKTLNCRDLGTDCDLVIRGDTEQQVLVRLIEHARRAHSDVDAFRDMERDFIDRMEAAIRDG